MTIIEYCTEEVERQGHDTSVLDGIERVAWMLEAWATALTRAEYPCDLLYVEMLGKMVEPDKNRHGFRTCGVRVGVRICPSPNDLPGLLERLFENYDVMSPIEFYREFELIHPFRDGNGRTGKILLNWKNGTLLSPIFPPNDLFGEPIRNP